MLPRAEGSARVFVAGDICPIGRMAEPFSAGECERIFGDVLPLIQGCDFAVANLEAPLAGDASAPIVKAGPNLRAPIGAASTLRRSGFSAVSLANNHIMDYGAAGLASTQEACAAVGLAAFGAAETLAEARKPLIVALQGVRVAFLAVAEDERCIASEESPGASPVDPIWIVRTLEEHRGAFDRLIVLVHGGNEGFAYPSPWLREQCRFLAERGADLVVCQHSHCVGALETHGRGTILYGQGNFIFDYASHGARGAEGLGLVVAFEGDKPAAVSFHPVAQAPGGDGIRLADEASAEALLARLRSQSEILQDPARYASAWASFCESKRPAFFTKLFGLGKWLQRLNRGGWMFRHLDAPALLRIYNLFSCESHRSALRGGLDALIARERRRSERA